MTTLLIATSLLFLEPTQTELTTYNATEIALENVHKVPFYNKEDISLAALSGSVDLLNKFNNGTNTFHDLNYEYSNSSINVEIDFESLDYTIK